MKGESICLITSGVHYHGEDGSVFQCRIPATSGSETMHSFRVSLLAFCFVMMVRDWSVSSLHNYGRGAG